MKPLVSPEIKAGVIDGEPDEAVVSFAVLLSVTAVTVMGFAVMMPVAMVAVVML